MKIIIDKQVDLAIHNFYEVSVRLHPSLDIAIVNAKINRLYDAIAELGQTHGIYPFARLKKSWIEANYHEMIAEDFHFAYREEMDEDGEQYIVVYDAVHSLLYYE